MTPEPKDWTEYDATNILALPLYRMGLRRIMPDLTEDAQSKHVYSNGTEHEMAQDDAEYLMTLGPVLRQVLYAGVRALSAEIEGYAMALASGDHEAIVAIETGEMGL